MTQSNERDVERRKVLATIGLPFSASLVGCLSITPEDKNDSTETESPTGDEPAFEIRFKEQEDDTVDSVRERVLVKNISGESQYMSGYTLTYSSGYECTFSGGLSLESRSTVAVVSQGAGDSVAESDPPTYYRDADFPELVLEDGEETVRLLNREDELVLKATYKTE